MINQIPNKQLYIRWDAMPDALKEATASETNSDIVWRTAESEHLSKEKIVVVSRLVGYVLMGFIHPEELANEIKNSLGIDARIAAAIAEPINKKVFQPIQESLEEIYAPAGEEPQAPKPVVLEEIIKPKTGQASAIPTPAPAPISQMPEPKKIDLSVPTPASATPAPISAPAPAIPTPTVTPAPAPVAAPVSKPVTGRQLPVNMFSRMPTGTAAKPMQEKVSEEKPAVSVAEKQAPPAMPEEMQAEEPMPFMLHQESESQPISPAKSSFKVGLSQEQFGKMEQKWALPPKPAQIETSAIEESIQKPTVQNQRVVHYGDMKTPLPPIPPKSAQPLAESGNPFEILRRNSNNSR